MIGPFLGRMKLKKPGDSHWLLRDISIVVVGLVLLFATLRITCYEDPEHFRRNACRSNLKQIGLAIDMYTQGNNGACPDDLFWLYPSYIANPKVFKCPSARGREGKAPRRPTIDTLVLDYVYFGKGYAFPDEDSMTGEQRAALAKKILAADKVTNHPDEADGAVINVLFGDGRVLELTPEQYQNLVKHQKFAR